MRTIKEIGVGAAEAATGHGDCGMGNSVIAPCSPEHLARYGEIYAAAFSGEPWNDRWRREDAEIHVRELLEAKTAYGLEYAENGVVAGFILGTSMLFHYGRTFEINDLAVDPAFQRRGIGGALLRRLIGDLRAQGICAVHLITAAEGALPGFYARYGFTRESEVMLMGMEM